MSKLKKAAIYLGFTRTEFNIILFLVSVFILGITLTAVKRRSSYIEAKNYDYKTKDSLFLKSAAGSNFISSRAEASIEDADSSPEREFYPPTVKASLPEKSININVADITNLIKLPGIGEKTAVKIIELRKKKGGFISIEELKEIKGIGDSKLEKISKYIYIE